MHLELNDLNKNRLDVILINPGRASTHLLKSTHDGHVYGNEAWYETHVCLVTFKGSLQRNKRIRPNKGLI